MAKEAATEAKKMAKEAATEAKKMAKQADKEAKKMAKEADKLAKKEAKKLAAIAARAEAKASKVPRAKKAPRSASPDAPAGGKKGKTVIDPVEVVLNREDLDRGAEPPALEEEECIEVEEIEWKGRSYLLSSDNTVYDDGHKEVGKWRNGQVTIQGAASPEPPAVVN